MANSDGGAGSTSEPQFSCSLVPNLLARAQLLPPPTCSSTLTQRSRRVGPLPPTPRGQQA